MNIICNFQIVKYNVTVYWSKEVKAIRIRVTIIVSPMLCFVKSTILYTKS